MLLHLTDDVLQSLPVLDSEGFGTGLVYRPEDPRDFMLERLPEIVQLRAEGLPESFSLAEHAETIYNQGQIPKCAASSTCTIKSIEERMDTRETLVYDDDELYRAAGGNGTNGVSSQAVMEYAKNQGLLIRGTQKRRRIDSYAWAPQRANEFRQVVAAAIMAKGPIQLAILVPTPFGWNSGTQATQGYHAVAGIGWEGLGDNDWCVVANSWGKGWGQAGLARVKWGYIEQGGGFANRYHYGVMVLDHKDGNTVPDPPPPTPNPAAAVVALVNQTRQGMGLNPLAVSDALQRAAAGHSVDMATRNFYSHTSPDGRGPRERLTAQGIPADAAWAENIAAGVMDPNAAFGMWMNSPPHRANMLNPQFSAIGCGFASGPGQYRYYWTQVFTNTGSDIPGPVTEWTIVKVNADNQTPTTTPGGVFTLQVEGLKPGQSLSGIIVRVGEVSCIVEAALSNTTGAVIRALAPNVTLTGRVSAELGGRKVVGGWLTVRSF